MYAYHRSTINLFNDILKVNQKTLPVAIEWMSETIINDNIIHAFGTGHSHMIGLELFVRAGGLANVNAFLDSLVMTSEGARRSAQMERISGISKVLWDQHKINSEDLKYDLNYTQFPLTNPFLSNTYTIYNQENDYTSSFGYKA